MVILGSGSGEESAATSRRLTTKTATRTREGTTIPPITTNGSPQRGWAADAASFRLDFTTAATRKASTTPKTATEIHNINHHRPSIRRAPGPWGSRTEGAPSGAQPASSTSVSNQLHARRRARFKPLQPPVRIGRFKPSVPLDRGALPGGA